MPGATDRENSDRTTRGVREPQAILAVDTPYTVSERDNQGLVALRAVLGPLVVALPSIADAVGAGFVVTIFNSGAMGVTFTAAPGEIAPVALPGPGFTVLHSIFGQGGGANQWINA